MLLANRDKLLGDIRPYLPAAAAGALLSIAVMLAVQVVERNLTVYLVQAVTRAVDISARPAEHTLPPLDY